MEKSFKGGRPPLPDRCDHLVKVRFNTSELDMLVHMMDKANETVKSTFIKQVLFGKPFKVLVTDKSLATYCAKLSEFFAQFRTVGVNYNLIVKELRTEFSEKKAMQYLYRLEKPQSKWLTSWPRSRLSPSSLMRCGRKNLYRQQPLRSPLHTTRRR